MRTIIAVAIMCLVGLLAGLVVYILARRAIAAVHAWIVTWRRTRLEKALEPWFAGRTSAPTGTSRFCKWVDRGVFLDICRSRLPDAPPTLRAGLVEWLDESGYVDRWIRQLRGRNAWRRECAAELLGIARTPRAVEPLVAALGDPVLDVRMRAARALSAFGGMRAYGAIVAALSDENRWSMIQIADLLREMGPGVVRQLVAAFPSMRRGAQLAAIDVLAHVGDTSAGALLTQLLRRPDSDIRARAAAALGRIGYREAVPRLIALLRDEAWPVRAMAAKALGALHVNAAVEPLCTGLKDREWWVRANSAAALRSIGPAGLEALRAMCNDADSFARDQAKAVLSAERAAAAGRAAVADDAVGTKDTASRAATGYGPKRVVQ